MTTLRKKHQILINDNVRMRAYERAIHKIVRTDDIVADMGCGLGVLSFMAARSGAARIHAVEVDPDTLNIARTETEHAGLTPRIIFHNGLAQKIAVPERVDVIVSETMGSFGFNENILPLLIDARTYWLKPGGRICPQALALTLAPADIVTPRRSGLHVMNVAMDALLAAPITTERVNFLETNERDLVVRPSFTFTRDGNFTGIAGWFTAWLAERISFCTGPTHHDTHWHQGFLPLRKPIPVRAGQQLHLIFGIGPDESGLQSVMEFDFEIV